MKYGLWQHAWLSYLRKQEQKIFRALFFKYFIYIYIIHFYFPIFYQLFHFTEAIFQMKNDSSSEILSRTLSGAMAGFVSRVVTAPLDVLKIRFQLQDSHSPRYTSLTHAVRRIIKEEGTQGLWKGSIPAVYLWVSYSAFQFMCYGELKRYGDSVIRRLGISDSSTPAHAAVNFLSGAGKIIS